MACTDLFRQERGGEGGGRIASCEMGPGENAQRGSQIGMRGPQRRSPEFTGPRCIIDSFRWMPSPQGQLGQTEQGVGELPVSVTFGLLPDRERGLRMLPGILAPVQLHQTAGEVVVRGRDLAVNWSQCLFPQA